MILEAEAALGETVLMTGLHITPLAVLEDSRCPAAVQCIQAGRLRLSARVELFDARKKSVLRKEEIFELPDPSAECLSLVDALPVRQGEEAIPAAAYRFRFMDDRSCDEIVF